MSCFTLTAMHDFVSEIRTTQKCVEWIVYLDEKTQEATFVCEQLDQLRTMKKAELLEFMRPLVEDADPIKWGVKFGGSGESDFGLCLLFAYAILFLGLKSSFVLPPLEPEEKAGHDEDEHAEPPKKEAKEQHAKSDKENDADSFDPEEVTPSRRKRKSATRLRDEEDTGVDEAQKKLKREEPDPEVKSTSTTTEPPIIVS